MANHAFNIPIKGYSEILPPDKQPALTTGYMNNMFPRGALERKIRLVQRPGLDKVFTQQVGGTPSAPTVFMFTITTVD